MYRLYFFSTIISIFFFSSCNVSSNEFKVRKVKFNDNWEFIRLDSSQNILSLEDLKIIQDWESVQLPHTTKIEPKNVNDQWQGISWYKKIFSIEKSQKGKVIYLQFDGAMNIAEVWVNGIKKIKHQGGYLPFVIEISKELNYDNENEVIVKLNNYDNPVTGPKPLSKLDFNTYGGIYRNVWLITKNKLHISHPIYEDKIASGGIFVSYDSVSKESALLNIKTHIKNQKSNSKSVIVKHILMSKDSIIISSESKKHSLSSNKDKQFSSQIKLLSPKLWSPNSPNLYQLKTQIINGDEIIDEEINTIGIKHIEFKNQELYLNGEKTFLRGVNRHQEYPFIGYALSDNANYRDAKKIKDAGFDYVRLSHYPQSESFMDACDELGLISINAILGWQYFSKDTAFQKHVFQTAKDLIRRNRNRASVLAWEVSLNESWMPEEFIDSLTSIAKKEYPTNQCFTAGWQSYGYDIYLQARQHRLQHYDESIKKPYNVSEYGDWEYYAMNAGLNQDSWGNLLQEERSSRQLRSSGESGLLQQATNIQEAHNDNLKTPAFADGYWVMYDYNRGYANDLEASGIMDLFRIPKFSYYFYQSQRSADESFGKPVLKIASYWTEQSAKDIRIFSNCDEVELFLNGKSLGKQKPDNNRISTHLKHPPFTFSVSEFEAGKLKAIGIINGKEVITDIVQTPEKPEKITIEIDNSINRYENELFDYFFVYTSIKDKNNTTIPSANNQLVFEISDNAEIIGPTTVNAEAGIASILIKKETRINNIKLSVSDTENNLKTEKILFPK